MIVSWWEKVLFYLLITLIWFFPAGRREGMELLSFWKVYCFIIAPISILFPFLSNYFFGKLLDVKNESPSRLVHIITVVSGFCLATALSLLIGKFLIHYVSTFQAVVLAIVFFVYILWSFAIMAIAKVIVFLMEMFFKKLNVL